MCFLIGTSLDMVLTYNHSAYTYMIYLYLAMHVLGYRLVVCNAVIYTCNIRLYWCIYICSGFLMLFKCLSQLRIK